MRSCRQKVWEYLRGFVVAPNGHESIRKILNQFEYIISFYLCFLLVLRGDLLSLVYVVLLFCYGLLSPVCLSPSFTRLLLLTSAVTTWLRFLVQTPLFEQTTLARHGDWILRLLVRLTSLSHA